MDAERTVHGPFRFKYAYYARVTIKFYSCTTIDIVPVQCLYLSWISNSASRLLVCNRKVERDPVLKP